MNRLYLLLRYDAHLPVLIIRSVDRAVIYYAVA